MILSFVCVNIKVKILNLNKFPSINKNYFSMHGNVEMKCNYNYKFITMIFFLYLKILYT